MIGIHAVSKRCTVAACLLGAVVGLAAAGDLPKPRVKTVETQPLRIDTIYHSMAGPWDRLVVDASDLDWVTAFRTEVVDARSRREIGDEFFCHGQMQTLGDTRLFVTATGTAEIRFPPGFAMPVREIVADLPAERRKLTFLGMVLNNYHDDIDFLTRVRATIEYWREEDLTEPPKRLYKVELPMIVAELDPDHPDTTESEGDVATHCVLVEEGFRGHWMVPPGPQITRRTMRGIVPVKSTVHFVAAHLHNHGVYVRLKDQTTGEVLWQADALYEPDRRQIVEIPVYSSESGFTLYPDREYELEARYDNTTDEDVDAMAALYVFFHPIGNEKLSYTGTLGD